MENPADVPVVVQILPLHLYPNVQTLLETITPSILPLDFGSELNVGAGDDVSDVDVFTLPDLLEPIAPSSTTDATSLLVLRKAAENTLGMRPHKRTLALLVKAKSKLTIRAKFQPKDDLLRTSMFVIR